MKYFKVRFGCSSSEGQWEFYSLMDDADEEDAKDLALENNHWVESAPIYNWDSIEITKSEYDSGIQAMNYFAKNPKMLQENMFPVKEWALVLANPKKPVRIGYPNHHMVYRMNDKMELSYQYDYSSSKFGVLKAFQKAYPV